MSRTTTMTVRLRGALSDFVAANASEDGVHENISGYIRDLIRPDKDRAEQERFDWLRAKLVPTRVVFCLLIAILASMSFPARAQEARPDAQPVAGVYGPIDPAASPPPEIDSRHRSFGGQVDAVKWEMAGVIAFYTLINSPKLTENPRSPHFQKEGWFGTSTANMGVDKVTHAYSAYIISELLHARLRKKTGGAPGTPLTAAALGLTATLYSELWDSIEQTSGWSWEDVTFDALGAGFSMLRNSVPGLDKKLDFRLMIIPNSDIFTRTGKRHYAQQRHFLALKLSGFRRLEDGPLRFVELHGGYYASDFTNEDRANGVRPKRHIFFGVGLNLRELLFKNPSTRAGRAAGEVLDYVQPPYTAVHVPVTD